MNFIEVREDVPVLDITEMIMLNDLEYLHIVLDNMLYIESNLFADVAYANYKDFLKDWKDGQFMMIYKTSTDDDDIEFEIHKEDFIEIVSFIEDHYD